jgi:hypothetical protein
MLKLFILIRTRLFTATNFIVDFNFCYSHFSLKIVYLFNLKLVVKEVIIKILQFISFLNIFIIKFVQKFSWD